MPFSTTYRRAVRVGTETIQLADTTDADTPTAGVDQLSSVIDFFLTDRSFTVLLVNEEGPALTSPLNVHIEAAPDRDGPYGVLETNVIKEFEDEAVAVAFDPVKQGAAPFYRLRLSPKGASAGESVTIAVMQQK
jgi:hypothetical protein